MRSRSHARRFARRRGQTHGDACAADAYRRLADLAGLMAASVAYADRATIEAHLERPLSAAEWTAVARELAPMAFDEHVGEAGTLRNDWIEEVLFRAGVPGRRLGTPPGSLTTGPSRECSSGLFSGRRRWRRPTYRARGRVSPMAVLRQRQAGRRT